MTIIAKKPSNVKPIALAKSPKVAPGHAPLIRTPEPADTTPEAVSKRSWGATSPEAHKAIADRIESRKRWSDFELDEDSSLPNTLMVNGSTVVQLCNEKGDFLKITHQFDCMDPVDDVRRIFTTNLWQPELKRQCEAIGGKQCFKRSREYYYSQSRAMSAIELMEHESLKFGDGLYVTVIDDTNPKERLTTRLCITTLPVMAVGIVEDSDTGIKYVHLEILNKHSKSGEWCSLHVAMSELINHTSIESVIGSFADQFTLTFHNSKKSNGVSQFKNYISAFTGEAVITDNRMAYTQSGWKKFDDGKKELVGPGIQTDSNIIFLDSLKDPKRPFAGTKGDKYAYLDFVRQVFDENPTVFLFAGFVAAGTLLEFLGNEDFNPIISILGDSSIGKSILLKFCDSMSRNPSKLKTLNSTDNALGALLARSGATGLCLDENGMLILKDANQLIYKLACGMDKARMPNSKIKGMNHSDPEKQYCTILTTGEKSLRAEDPKTGALIRLTDSLFSKANPLWEGVDEARIKEINSFIHQNYGWLWPRVIENVKDDALELKYRLKFQAYSARFCAGFESQQERRKATVWAIAMAGVECLADALDMKRLYKGEHELNEFSYDMTEQIEAAALAAHRLIARDADIQVASKTTDKYMDFLESAPNTLATDIICVNNDTADFPQRPSSRPCIGKYTFETIQGYEHHTLSIYSTKFDAVCMQHNLTPSMLKDWAKDKGYLKVNSKGEDSLAVRIEKGKTPTKCVTFAWVKGKDDLDLT
jgi:hypothetical protein